MLLQMSDKLVFLDNLLDEIVQLAISGEIEKAGQVFSMLASELELFFSSGMYQHYTKNEVNDFALRMNHALSSLQIKQKEIQNQVAAITQLGSNKVSRRYLTK